MNVITVGSTAQDLCDKLAAAAMPGFFDSVEMEEGSTTSVLCKIDGNVVLNILTPGVIYLGFADGTNISFSRQGAVLDYISTIVVTNKAVILQSDSLKTPFVITKDTSGNVVFLGYMPSINPSVLNPYSSQGGATPNVEMRTVTATTGNIEYRSFYLNSDTANRRSYCVPALANDGLMLDDVYIGLVRPYPNEPGYMQLTIGNTQYVGFGGTTFIVKA